ncbi:hypothetical protein D3C85_1611980 [compost metagenome]
MTRTITFEDFLDLELSITGIFELGKEFLLKSFVFVSILLAELGHTVVAAAEHVCSLSRRRMIW